MRNLAFKAEKIDKIRRSWPSERERWSRKLELLSLKVDNPIIKSYNINAVNCLKERKCIVSQCKCGHIVIKPLRCKHRFFCPDCARELSRRALGRFAHILDKTQEKRTNVFFLTVTLKNPAFLTKNYLKKVKECFYKLRRPDSSPIHNNGIARIECPPGKAGDWNLHIHCLFWTHRSDPSVIQKELVSRWTSITARYMPERSCVVSVEWAHKKHVVELLKYAMKLGKAEELLDNDNKYSEFLNAFRRIRILWTWGDVYAINKIMKFICPACGESNAVHCIRNTTTLPSCNSPP